MSFAWLKVAGKCQLECAHSLRRIWAVGHARIDDDGGLAPGDRPGCHNGIVIQQAATRRCLLHAETMIAYGLDPGARHRIQLVA